MTDYASAELAAEPTNKDGVPCFRVPLTGRDGTGRFALVDPEGLERLRSVGARALYLVSDGDGREYVTFIIPSVRHRTYTAARVIAQAPQGLRVEYYSGDRLDLRLANLRVKAGFAAARAPMDVTEAARTPPAGVLMTHQPCRLTQVAA